MRARVSVMKTPSGALFEGQGQLAQLLLGQLALGDVQMDAKEAHGPLLGVPIDAPLCSPASGCRHLAAGS